MIDPHDFIITRKRKKYKFALFANADLCFEAEDWRQQAPFQPDCLEVGAGSGLFSLAQAQLHPDNYFVAIDVKADRLQHGARKAEHLGLKNLCFVRVEGRRLTDYFHPHSLKAVWVTFPDPFPRERSAKHRLTHQHFLALYQKLLQPGGAIYFKTDNHALFDWSIEHLVAHKWQITQLSYDLHSSDLPDDYKQLTTYESRFLNQGFTTCFLSAQPPIAGAATNQSNLRP